jgi:Swi5-dependent recombination DNA repair protein 1
VKWRHCAQKTAERVFVTARNRIDRMGGFREFMKIQKERVMTWDDGQDKEGQRASESQEESVEQETAKEEGDDPEEEFTIEIMLRMAGVEENLIGWDRGLNNFAKE